MPIDEDENDRKEKHLQQIAKRIKTKVRPKTKVVKIIETINEEVVKQLVLKI